jgi:guanylate kinase
MSKVFSGKAIILSAPSGAGKTTIVKNLIKTQIPIVFSISACSRTKRNNEKNGKDYYFLSIEEFKNNINNNSFIEWEEVYENNFYGTLKTEIIRIWESNNHVIFDVDVIGGIALKKYFNEKALSIFIDPPSTEVLFERLRKRDTDDSHSLKRRMEKAESELSYKNQFDQIITNDKLEIAIKQTTELVQNFISR